MTNPRKAIAYDRQGQKPQQLARSQSPYGDYQDQETSSEMQTATGDVAVLFEVVRIKFGKVIEGLLVAHCVATQRCTTASFIIVGRPDYD